MLQPFKYKREDNGEIEYKCRGMYTKSTNYKGFYNTYLKYLL